MQTQTTDVIQQFYDTLKTHSIVVDDREILVKLFESVVELCTQMPKTKLKAAVKAATKNAVANTKKAPAAKKTPAPAKKAQPPVEVVEPGAAEVGVCPLESDIAKPIARGRGRPRKTVSTEAVVVGTVATPAGEAEKKKRGRPKKDKSVVMSSNDDEDALIAKMITDAKKMKELSDAGDETESVHSDVSVSPVPVHHVSEMPMEVEADVPEVVIPVTKKATKEPKAKAVKEPKAKAVKEPKAKAVKEPKAKAVKEPKAKAVKETKETKAIDTEAPAVTAIAVIASEAPVRENKAQSDGKFYLMPNYPRSSFSFSGKTYLRTENDNVYDNLTLELIGVWDHLNHEIITTFDDEEDVEDLWMSDEE